MRACAGTTPLTAPLADQHYRVRQAVGHEEGAEREVQRAVPRRADYAEQAAQHQARDAEDRPRVLHRHRHHRTGQW